MLQYHLDFHLFLVFQEYPHFLLVPSNPLVQTVLLVQLVQLVQHHLLGQVIQQFQLVQLDL